MKNEGSLYVKFKHIEEKVNSLNPLELNVFNHFLTNAHIAFRNYDLESELFLGSLEAYRTLISLGSKQLKLVSEIFVKEQPRFYGGRTYGTKKSLLNQKPREYQISLDVIMNYKIYLTLVANRKKQLSEQESQHPRPLVSLFEY
jgi:hypothetical protein